LEHSPHHRGRQVLRKWQGSGNTDKLSETIEVGVFADRPGQGAFDTADVLLMQRRAARADSQVIEIVSRQKPRVAGVDPYNFYIDKNSDDHLVAVD
jgi:ABC-2 type transport system permease protein